MGELAAKECVPCRGGIPPLTAEAIGGLLREVPSWEVVQNHHLTKTFKFSDFSSALDFVNQVGVIADQQGHHPDVFLTWGKARLEIWTHKIDGLTESDFILAAKIDRLNESIRQNKQ